LCKAGEVIGEILRNFELVRKIRRTDPKASLEAAGVVAVSALTQLEHEAERHEIPWKGAGEKQYDVFAAPGDDAHFSRGVNQSLFISDPADFARQWSDFLRMLERSKGSGHIAGMKGLDVDRLFYTSVVGFGATVDIFSAGNRGGPGTFFECLVGPSVAWLTDREEESSVQVPLPTTEELATVTTDLSFAPARPGEATLVIPTKISTRERISQAYAHQRILDSYEGRTFRSALCVANENNMAGKRSVRTAFLKDTLVPKTIIQYEAFLARLAGLYYLDPPAGYLPPPELFPPVKRFHELLTADLPGLVA
jgi:hypothetical protein